MANQGKTLVRKAPAQPNNSRTKPVGKHSEKIAVKPNLPVEELLQDFIRQQIAPNSNDGNSYYVGQVVKVINKDDPSVYIYDIFEDSLVNVERFSNDSNKKEKENTIKVLVHIPELFSIGEEVIKPDNKFIDELHYSTAFKILYTGKDAIEEGNFVKVIFKNTHSFKDPEITAIYRSNQKSNIIDISRDKIKKAFKSDLDCRVDQLSGSNPNPANINVATLSTPSLGYYQFFNNLELLLTERAKQSFLVNYIAPGPTDSVFKNLNISISCSKRVESTIGNNNIVKSKIKTTEVDNDEYLIKIEMTHPESSVLSKFYTFLEKNLTALQFAFTNSDIFSNEGKNCKIDVDILAFSAQKGEIPSLDVYLKNSEDLKNNGTLILDNQDIVVPEQSSNVISSNTTSDLCDNQAPGNPELYLEPDRKYQKFIDKLLLNKKEVSLPYDYGFEVLKAEDLLSTRALYISGEKILNKDRESYYTFDNLQKINKSFYSLPERILRKKQQNSNIVLPTCNSSYNDSRKHFITEQALNSRLEKLSYFLNKMRNEIQRIEQIPLNNVLIVPINVLRAKKRQSKEYEYSRHFFGLAVDFVVFVKYDNNIIKQIPADVVYLYCRKVSGSEKTNTGNGIYLGANYNHFEFLLDISGEEDLKGFLSKLRDDERSNGRIWVEKEELDGELKNINEKTSEKVEETLINYILKTKGSILTGITANKIMRLL